MDVVITEWALESYLNLKYENVFSADDYKNIIRPDVELLKDGFPPQHAKFKNGKFWSSAQGKNGEAISKGYKMKWHNIGNGRVQLRLPVVIHDAKAFLCQAFVKSSEAVDYREMAKLKIRVRDIELGRYITRGTL